MTNEDMNEVTYHMVAAGSRMASDLITAQVSRNMDGIGVGPRGASGAPPRPRTGTLPCSTRRAKSKRWRPSTSQ